MLHRHSTLCPATIPDERGASGNRAYVAAAGDCRSQMMLRGEARLTKESQLRAWDGTAEAAALEEANKEENRKSRALAPRQLQQQRRFS